MQRLQESKFFLLEKVKLVEVECAYFKRSFHAEMFLVARSINFLKHLKMSVVEVVHIYLCIKLGSHCGLFYGLKINLNTTLLKDFKTKDKTFHWIYSNVVREENSKSCSFTFL